MTYDDSEVNELLAGDYVLGTMPRRARARLERLIETTPALAQSIDRWAARLAPLDAATPPVLPPASAWPPIAARLAVVVPLRPRWFQSVPVWRGIAAGALAAAATLALVVVSALSPSDPAGGRVVAVLTDDSGAPGLVATAGARPGEVVLAAVGAVPIDAAHTVELWGIAGSDPPRPLGLISAPGQRILLRQQELPAAGGMLAVSREPPGGSPTGAPTGPVLYKGRVIWGRSI